MIKSVMLKWMSKTRDEFVDCYMHSECKIV